MDIFWTVFYVAIAMAAAARWLWKRWKTRGHPQWPMAEGTVESYRWERGRYTTTWFVIYSYSAAGDYYSGEFNPQLSWKSKFIRSQDKVEDNLKTGYPVGAKFPLRFNPDEPQWSVPFDRQALAHPLTAGT